ncbi:MAG: MmgE/PrpD family protein [Candidatus Marinimicrobia bacterium]|nr:MmgE/PrpD family protein [Candidatus Neomarinimicrobiota bacterium]MDD5582408.1 MmgE/PrpD family protein [Candidatus Neomarinimicrobiota bacterium]
MTDVISRKIARYAVNLTYNKLPKEVIEQVKRFLYDSIGCALGSMETRDVTILRDVLNEMKGESESTVFGFGDKLPALNATLLNSLMIRSLDFNDIYWKEDPSHPSDLIPAALGLAEKVNASMKDVLVAIVLGYEFEQRLCEWAKPGFRERKWHHATLTQFVSPLVAGKILGLSENEMVNAIGINGCHNHTIGCPTAGKLSMMKNTVDPMAVQAGVFAALLAQKGYIGTEAIFEGKEGVKDVYGPAWDDKVLTDGLGESYRIMECGMKAFPTEALTHTHLSAAIKIVTENDISYSDIEEVVITTIARACDILFDPHKYRPESRETADHSLPYCIARALIDKKITTESFTEEKLKDPRLWEIIDKIKGEASEEFEKMFPEKQPSNVKITLKDGRVFKQYLEYPKGDPREPMTLEDLKNKFSALTKINNDKMDSLTKTIFSCETLSARSFMQKMVL